MAHTITLDIRGQLCPSCLLLTLKELNQHGLAVRAGETEVVVITDDRQATTTIPAAAERMGFCAQIEHLDGLYHIRLYGNG